VPIAHQPPSDIGRECLFFKLLVQKTLQLLKALTLGFSNEVPAPNSPRMVVREFNA
jgi:hypothetical protein